MAVTFTVTPVKTYVVGDRKEVIVDVSCSGQPTVGGDAIAASTLGLDLELDFFQPLGNAVNSGATSGYVVGSYHGTAGGLPTSVTVSFLVQGTAGAANAMVATTATLSSHVFRARAVGKGKGL